MKKILLITATLMSINGIAAEKMLIPDQSTQTVSTKYPSSWETLKLQGLNLKRLQVPGGWIIREGLGKLGGLALDAQERKMIFVPDAQNKWQEVLDLSWQKIALKGLNLYRLKTPNGWLVREGVGKIGSIDQTLGILYLNDVNHTWSIKE